jgi:sterol desaturase/sphingolipid hydroxylase (fatty acid hydroxylase superfamily)
VATGTSQGQGLGQDKGLARHRPGAGAQVRTRQAAGLAGRLAPGPVAIVAVSAFLAWQGWRALSPVAGGPVRAMTTQGLVLVGPAVLVLVAVGLAAERRWPAVRRPLRAAGHRQDAIYLALYALVAVPVVTLLGTGFAVTLFKLAPWLRVHSLSPAPRWALVVLVVVVMDACNWFGHFLNHRVTTFWRYHALHHSQEEMSILTSFRAHPLVHASFQVATLPLLLLGTAGAVPPTVLITYVVLSTVPHANVPWSFGPLRYVLVSPAYHRLHHAREDERGVNLGTVFVWWDVLAHLAVFPERGAVPVATGLQRRPIPVEQAAEAGGWLSLLSVVGRQLVEPFRPATRSTMPEGTTAPSTIAHQTPSLALARSAP